MDDIFAETNRRQDELFEKLAACPIQELCGIVSPSGVGAGKSVGEVQWTVSFTLDAWRVRTEPIHTQPLTLRRKVADDERRTLQAAINAETIIRKGARVVEENAFGTPQGHLEEFLGVEPTDAELSKHLVELQKPKTPTDAQFGTLTLDRRVGWYSAVVSWNGESVKLCMSAEQPADFDTALKVARSLWNDAPSWNQRIGEFAVRELLPLKNESWLGDDEAQVSADGFRRRMKLESITVYPDESFEFWHDDGDLFWGHAIHISGTLSDGPTDADILG